MPTARLRCACRVHEPRARCGSPDPHPGASIAPALSVDAHGRERRGERGVALAELTVVVPIMLALLLVVFDFGRGFMEFVSVSNGARDGARMAAQYDIDCADSGDQAIIQAAALAASAPLASPTVVVSPGPGGLCSVTVSYTYNMLIPFVNSELTLPIMGQMGPLWDGTMSETMVSS